VAYLISRINEITGVLIILLNVVRCQCDDGDVWMNFFGGENIEIG
jgi:hypothetical protein